MTTLDRDRQAALPRWDTTSLYPSLADRAVTDAQESLAAQITRLAALYDRHRVEHGEPHRPTADEVAAFDEVLAATNEVADSFRVMRAYIHAFVSTDSYDDLAQSKASELEVLGATVDQLSARFTAWVAALGADALADASASAAEHRGPLRRLEVRAAHQMAPSEEALFSDLAVTGSTAWYRLHGDVTSQLVGTVHRPDGVDEVMAMTAIRNLATNPDPALRRAGYDAELAAWPTVGVACAAAMNAIKGEANTVNARRRWVDPLDASLYANSVSRATFDAMQAAVDEALPALRRFMRVKSRLHGHDGALPWWDLVAPLPFGTAPIDFEHGSAAVIEAFATFSPALSSMARRAVDERWIDVGPRQGKRGGAFCMPFVDDRSLVLLNWTDSIDAVQTLAHELGHAYHNTQLTHRTSLQRQLPMTLAETASIFCETIMIDAALSHTRTESDSAARLAILDLDLADAAQVVVDIRSRFDFESAVFARRRARTLSVDELCTLMLDAQLAAYGDGLDQTTAHRWMWAVKPHYYGSHFYNWPYTFGSLFGLGLFARYEQDPDRFRRDYDELLSMVGMAEAEALGARFDIDITDIAFWRASLDTFVRRIDEYERLAEEHLRTHQ